ncbi:MAG: DNA replication/repair protein RecF [Ruminococcaceae bacterium]|nr:DNA replication/repair protein RecF [Oscillospiraceae bacterium]
MICKSVEFINFRNIENEKIEFTEGINVIHGENAQGKTNILEGIYIFARGKSFRAFKDRELIRFGSDGAIVKLDYEKKDGVSNLGVEISKSSVKKFYKNKIKANKTSDIIGDFRAVLFCPSHLGIIKDSPSVRRRFLDVAISQLRPIYIKMLAKYNSVMEQRNAILKMEPSQRQQYEGIINDYSDELASLCADIAGMRIDYIKKLDLWVKIFFDEMMKGKETPKITYESNAKENDLESRESLKNKYSALLKDNLEKEYKYGATLYGIHKDDLKIEINGRDARFYSSQGQSRSLALAMKMAEGEISREYTGEYPVFLFDDVLSELDENRRKYILSKIEKRQVIITSCEPFDFNEIEKTNFIEIKDGRREEIKIDKDFTSFEDEEDSLKEVSFENEEVSLNEEIFEDEEDNYLKEDLQEAEEE